VLKFPKIAWPSPFKLLQQVWREKESSLKHYIYLQYFVIFFVGARRSLVLVLTLTCWRRPELYIRERVKKFSHFWPGTRIFHNEALCLYIFFAGREVPLGITVPWVLSLARRLKFASTLKLLHVRWLRTDDTNEERRKEVREGWKSFIHVLHWNVTIIQWPGF